MINFLELPDAVRYGADITITAGEPIVATNKVQLSRFRQSSDFAVEELTGNNNVVPYLDKGFPALIIRDLADAGVKVLPGIENAYDIAPGETVAIPFLQYLFTVTGNANEGVTLNGQPAVNISEWHISMVGLPDYTRYYLDGVSIDALQLPYNGNRIHNALLNCLPADERQNAIQELAAHGIRLEGFVIGSMEEIDYVSQYQG